MTLPINVIFGHLQVRRFVVFVHRLQIYCHYFVQSLNESQSISIVMQKKTRVRIWLYEDTKMQLEGQIIGFDEYMNMVLDDAVEIGKKRTEVGRILLKGDAITCIQEANPVKKE